MGGADKMFAQLGGKTILALVVETFQKCDSIDQIILVVNQQNVDKVRQLVAKNRWEKITEVCVGGKRRQDSVVAGLGKLDSCDWVVIHDGARPLVTKDLIEQGLEAAKETGAIVTAEEHQEHGGLASAVSRITAQQYPIPMEFVAVKDRFGMSGKPAELLERYGLTAKDIATAVKTAIKRKR